MEKGVGGMEYFLAIDIGASSGRHILGYIEDGKIKLEEIYRFENGIKKVDREYIPSTLDRASILKQLNLEAKNNIFEYKYCASMTVLDAYKYLLKLQDILFKLNEMQQNKESLCGNLLLHRLFKIS